MSAACHTVQTWGSFLSSSDKQSMAFVKTSFTRDFSSAALTGIVRQTHVLTSVQLPTAGTWTCNQTIVQTFNVASTESTVDRNMYLSWSLVLRAPGQRLHSCVCWNWRWLLAAYCAPWSSWPTWSSWRHLLYHPFGPSGQLGHLHLGARALTSENYLLGNCPASYKVNLWDEQVKMW